MTTPNFLKESAQMKRHANPSRQLTSWLPAGCWQGATEGDEDD